MTTSIDGLQELATRLADWCGKRAAPGTGDAVRAAAIAVTTALAEGHACVPLAQIPGGTTLRQALHDSGVVGDGSDGAPPAPIVLDAHDRVYLARLFAAEQRLALALRERLARTPAEPSPALLAALRALPRSGTPDWQQAAIAAAVRAPFAVITGGPGTGKTTTTARLVQVLRQAQPDLRLALAAPTGKASSRLGEAIARLVADAPQPTTLHRLLEYLADEDRFRRSPARPLDVDLVVVDEVSMVDLELMAALVAALPPHARLLLIGDRDQLTSIGTGQVLADLCRAAKPELGVGRELAAFCRAHLDLDLPVQASASPLAAAVVALRVNHRFGSQPGIGAFALALAERAPARALAALQHGHADLRLLPPGPLAQPLADLWPALTASLRATSPAAALHELARARILCATRHGPHGVEATNAAVEHMLTQHGHRTDGLHYHGRPVLVTANDHDGKLFNGDLGIVWRSDDDELAVFFADGKGGARKVPLLRLPPHETAWAMTVHKSQGSEFDEVLLLLPDQPSPLLTAPLVYTGVTRARRMATVVADLALLTTALATEPQRGTGLGQLLGERGDDSAAT